MKQFSFIEIKIHIFYSRTPYLLLNSNGSLRSSPDRMQAYNRPHSWNVSGLNSSCVSFHYSSCRPWKLVVLCIVAHSVSCWPPLFESFPSEKRLCVVTVFPFCTASFQISIVGAALPKEHATANVVSNFLLQQLSIRLLQSWLWPRTRQKGRNNKIVVLFRKPRFIVCTLRLVPSDSLFLVRFRVWLPR